MDTKIALFRSREIRRTVHNDEWWFVITDTIAALTDSPNPSGYLKDMRRRDPAFAELFDKGGGQIAPPLPCRFKHRAARNAFSRGTPRAFSASSNPFPARDNYLALAQSEAKERRKKLK